MGGMGGEVSEVQEKRKRKATPESLAVWAFSKEF